MPLQSSGQISLGDVNVELGRSRTQQIGMNETVVRTLGGRASGSIGFNHFHGKSNCPPNGTYYGQVCSGCTLYNRYHNGSCGFYDNFVENNSTSCGCCPPYGQYYSNYCSGCTYYYRYHNGSCGYYDQVQQYNSPSCGCCPGYGTYYTDFCSGCAYYYRYHNGSCGYYDELQNSNSPSCGCGGGGGSACSGCSGVKAPGCQSQYVCGSTGFGGWGCSGYYTDDSNWGNIAVQQGIISPGDCTYVTVCEQGCGGYFSSCNQNGVYTNSYGSWCAATCC